MPLWLVGQLHNKVWIWHHGSFTCSVKHNTANTRNKWKNYIYIYIFAIGMGCHRTDRTIEFLILKEHLVDVALTKVALADSLDTWTQATHSWVAWRIAWILTRITSVPNWKPWHSLGTLENPWEHLGTKAYPAKGDTASRWFSTCEGQARKSHLSTIHNSMRDVAGSLPHSGEANLQTRWKRYGTFAIQTFKPPTSLLARRRIPKRYEKIW